MSDYIVSTDRPKLDIEFIVRSLQSTHWGRDRAREDIVQSIERSLCFGAYERNSGRQVGFARVVTDGIIFSWVCDIFVDPAHRRRGMGKMLVAEVLAHPEVARTRAFLTTKDAHSFYARFGFKRSQIMRRPIILPTQAKQPARGSPPHSHPGPPESDRS